MACQISEINVCRRHVLVTDSNVDRARVVSYDLLHCCFRNCNAFNNRTGVPK